MKTLKDYEELIRDTVREMDAKDPNWRWSVHSLEDNKVFIRWGYLDYCEEKSPFFILELHDYTDPDYPDEFFLTARVPGGDTMIEGAFVTSVENSRSWQYSWEAGIILLLHKIAFHARNAY